MFSLLTLFVLAEFVRSINCEDESVRDISYYYNQGYYYHYTAMDYQAARENYEKASFLLQTINSQISLPMHFAGLLNDLGVLRLHFGELDGAISSFERAIALYPSDMNAICNLADAVASRGDFQRSLALYQSALGLSKNNPIIFYNFGLLL
jgi:tetratricopeptide (TPR) repeat protein